MDTEKVYLDRGEAARLYQAYKSHANYSSPIDWECQRAYQLLAKGRLVIKALESVKAAGVNVEGLPKLALGRATAKVCFLERFANGRAVMTTTPRTHRPAKSNTFDWVEDSFEFAPHTFDSYQWSGGRSRHTRSNHQAQVPLVPIHLRPKRGLANYHILWEALWEPSPPRDPFLLRRIGNADLWLVVAQWDLTEVERAALATRIVR